MKREGMAVAPCWPRRCCGAAATRARIRPERRAAAGTTAASGADAPISVGTVAAVREDVVLEATGTFSALTSVDVRRRVCSTITPVDSREGPFDGLATLRGGEAR